MDSVKNFPYIKETLIVLTIVAIYVLFFRYTTVGLMGPNAAAATQDGVGGLTTSFAVPLEETIKGSDYSIKLYLEATGNATLNVTFVNSSPSASAGNGGTYPLNYNSAMNCYYFDSTSISGFGEVFNGIVLSTSETGQQIGVIKNLSLQKKYKYLSN